MGITAYVAYHFIIYKFLIIIYSMDKSTQTGVEKDE